MSLESLLRSVKRKAVAGLLGLSLALSPVYSCGGEEEKVTYCQSDFDCKVDRVCDEGKCVGEGDNKEGEEIEYSCLKDQDCDELVAATLFYLCAIEPEKLLDEGFRDDYIEQIIPECTNQHSAIMRECLETDQSSKILLNCWCEASKSPIISGNYESFPGRWRSCKTQYDR